MARKSLYPRSWIRPDISWSNLPQSVVLAVDANDPDLVELIATGSKSAQRVPKKVAETFAALVKSGPKNTLRSALLSAVNFHRRLKGLSPASDSPDDFVVYLHGAIQLPDAGEVAVIVGSSPSSFLPTIWLSPAAKQAASEAWASHGQALQHWREEQEAKKRRDEEFIDRLPAEQREKFRSMAHYSADTQQPPVPDASAVVSRLAQGVLVPLRGISPASRDAKVIASLTNTLIEPPRDGEHEGIVAAGHETKHCALVAWFPRGNLPPYPEILECLRSKLGKAFARPRRNDVSPPDFDFPPSIESLSVTGTVAGIDAIGDLPRNQLHDLSLPFNDPDAMAEAGRDAVRQTSFDAFGWYQSFHVWDEDTWGIYLLAEKLDEFACTLHEDLRQAGERSPGLAILLAVAIVYQHELFHARVEAGASWQELNAQQPKLLRYKRDVYAVARGKDEWLEEALANWSARSAILAKLPAWKTQRLVRDELAVIRVIDANLDLSPPGYNNWQAGGRRDTWRQFSTELMTGKAAQALKSLPLPNESLLADPLPFDLREDDIPVRIVGHGVIADWLLANPATFSTPTRKEIERALKFFGYQCDKSRGKGSHELWSGDDKRAFPVPRRDPLSRGVFNSFLHHFGLDKMKYVLEIRPQL